MLVRGGLGGLRRRPPGPRALAARPGGARRHRAELPVRGDARRSSSRRTARTRPRTCTASGRARATRSPTRRSTSSSPAPGRCCATSRPRRRSRARRVAELLDRIGPAIVVANSAGGPCAFLAADARPGLVKALIEVETIGPPFAELPPLGVTLQLGPHRGADRPSTRPCPIRPSSAGKPRAIPNLAGFPIAVVSARSVAVRALRRADRGVPEGAGCDVERVRLADHGVHGNGHGMMFERNNREALGCCLGGWRGAGWPESGPATTAVTRRAIWSMRRMTRRSPP